MGFAGVSYQGRLPCIPTIGHYKCKAKSSSSTPFKVFPRYSLNAFFFSTRAEHVGLSEDADSCWGKENHRRKQDFWRPTWSIFWRPYEHENRVCHRVCFGERKRIEDPLFWFRASRSILLVRDWDLAKGADSAMTIGTHHYEGGNALPPQMYLVP